MRKKKLKDESLTYETDEETKEPTEYFKILKSSLSEANENMLNDNLAVIAEHLISAKSVGQKSLMNKLAFTYDVIIKEQILLTRGIYRYVDKDDIQKFIDKIEPANSIKIIELERYPRVIPLDSLQAIEKIKDQGIFYEYCIVFTDFTEGEYSTPEDKEFVKKNRDPIVFGLFTNRNSCLQHSRFYFITDWEDEYCDLTFDRMITKMAKLGIKNADKKITQDSTYIQELVKDTLSDLNGDTKKDNFFTRLIKSRKAA